MAMAGKMVTARTQKKPKRKLPVASLRTETMKGVNQELPRSVISKRAKNSASCPGMVMSAQMTREYDCQAPLSIP